MSEKSRIIFVATGTSLVFGLLGLSSLGTIINGEGIGYDYFLVILGVLVVWYSVRKARREWREDSHRQNQQRNRSDSSIR